MKIFVRVNQAGVTLSKSDLLFSTIVATWDSGREKIEELQKSINKIGDGYSYSNNFIMRAALMLLDLPIRHKVSSFKSDNVEKIKNQWTQIERSIRQAANLVYEFGLSDANLVSKNSVIPLAYYIYKGGIINEAVRIAMKSFLISSLLKNIYGGHGDSLLSSLQSGMRNEIRNADGES